MYSQSSQFVSRALNSSSSKYTTVVKRFAVNNAVYLGANSFRSLNFIHGPIQFVHGALNLSTNSGTENDPRKMKRSKETVELITLLDSKNNNLGVKSKSDAEILAKKHNQSLIKLDSQSFGKKYPVYKLSTSIDYFEKKESNANKSTVRECKKLSISCRISDHDLQTKLKTVRKWLNNNCEIQVVITGEIGKEELSEQKYKIFEDLLKGEARFLQKRIVNGILKFGVIPPKKEKIPSSTSAQIKLPSDK